MSYRSNSYLEGQIKRYLEIGLTESQQKDLKEFVSLLEVSGRKPGTVKSIVFQLNKFAQLVGKDFRSVTKQDIVKALSEVQKHWKPSTVDNLKSRIKQFIRWLYSGNLEGDYPKVVSWIRCYNKMKHIPFTNGDDLFTDQELEKMLRYCNGSMRRAFLMTIWESGCRIGEILNMNFESVSFDHYGCVIYVDGKTGPRRVRLAKASPYLQVWLNNHPNRFKGSPLWIVRYRGTWRRWSYTGAQYFLCHRLPKMAGVRRRNIHMFRHSRMTYLAKHLTEAELNVYAGWTQGSRMSRRYVHLSGRDLDNKLLALSGIKEKPVDELKQILKPLICGRCSKANPGDAKYCYRCGLILTDKGLKEAIAKQSSLDRLSILMDDDEKFKKLLHVLSNI